MPLERMRWPSSNLALKRHLSRKVKGVDADFSTIRLKFSTKLSQDLWRHWQQER